MDKVVRRTAQAVRQAQRKARLQAEHDTRLARKTYFRSQKQRAQVFIEAQRRERAEFRENWLKGPLAPVRDAGAQRGVFGSANMAVYSLPVIPEVDRRKFVNFAVGDFVCIVRGREKGRIDKVSAVSKETESVTLKDSNKYEIEIPEPYIDSQSPNATQTIPVPLPLDDVRLVYPLYNPQTGKTEDTIIEKINASGPFLDRPYHSSTPRHTRYIEGTDIQLDWPRDERRKHEALEVDTPRILVEKSTFVPMLEAFPFPASVVDELRNKYSVFRTRHEGGYLAGKVEESVRREWAEKRKLVTPRAEARQQEVEGRRARREDGLVGEEGKVRLPEESVRFIREVMEGKKGGEAKVKVKAASL